MINVTHKIQNCSFIYFTRNSRKDGPSTTRCLWSRVIYEIFIAGNLKKILYRKNYFNKYNSKLDAQRFHSSTNVSRIRAQGGLFVIFRQNKYFNYILYINISICGHHLRCHYIYLFHNCFTCLTFYSSQICDLLYVVCELWSAGSSHFYIYLSFSQHKNLFKDPLHFDVDPDPRIHFRE